MHQSTRIIKRRIRSSQNISQITKAMEMVSAAKMKRAQTLAINSRPYTDTMAEIISSLVTSAKADIKHFLFHDPRPGWDPENEFKVLIVVFATDKGLCGGLNTNQFRGLEKWLKTINDEFSLPPKVKLNFVTVGRKAKEHILKSNRVLMAEFPQFGDRPRFADILPVTKLIMEGFRSHEYQMTFLCFMNFISTISQELTIKQLLPIKAKELTAVTPTAAVPQFEGEYIFEPSAQQIFRKLLPQYLELQLYHTLLESLASEHSARMVAMKSAHDNAVEIVGQLTLEYNQARQNKITGELLDVISARLALD